MKLLWLTLTVTLAAAQAPPAAPLASAVFDWERLVVKKTAKGERRDIVNAATATFRNFESHVTTLRAGEVAHEPHAHADEEIVIVKEGTLEAVFSGGRSQRAPAGSMLFFASNDRHGLKNVGGTPATYYVIRIITAATPSK
jgi:mannose-6-phosphate isomerase-like protein (cupin superfamily)